MFSGELRGYRASERVAIVGELTGVRSVSFPQILVRGFSVQLRSRVGRLSTQRHVSAILGQKNRVPCALYHFACPIELPNREIGVSVEAEENAGSGTRISDEISRERLSVRRLVFDALRLASRIRERRRLEKDSLLPPPQ